MNKETGAAMKNEVRRMALVVWVVQWHGEKGWWVWSAHKDRSDAWKQMRRGREEYAHMGKRSDFRVRSYMPEVSSE
jgi:hypothetical protein